MPAEICVESTVTRTSHSGQTDVTSIKLPQGMGKLWCHVKSSDRSPWRSLSCPGEGPRSHWYGLPAEEVIKRTQIWRSQEHASTPRIRHGSGVIYMPCMHVIRRIEKTRQRLAIGGSRSLHAAKNAKRLDQSLSPELSHPDNLCRDIRRPVQLRTRETKTEG